MEHKIRILRGDFMIENNSNNRICDTCSKEDVCMYKEELAKAVKDIMQISDRTNVFIDADVKCKKWLGKVVNYR